MSDFKTLKKFTDNIPNEDSCHVQDDMIAISDGAGGCGVFASDWSKYLVEQISLRSNENPIVNFEEFEIFLMVPYTTPFRTFNAKLYLI